MAPIPIQILTKIQEQKHHRTRRVSGSPNRTPISSLALRLGALLPRGLLARDHPLTRLLGVHGLQPRELVAIEERPVRNRDQERHHHAREVDVEHSAVGARDVAREESDQRRSQQEVLHQLLG